MVASKPAHDADSIVSEVHISAPPSAFLKHSSIPNRQ
jgi:hypothetical protein